MVTYRKLIQAGGTPEPPSFARAAATDPHAKEQSVRVAKMDAFFQMLMEDVVDAAELGLTVDNLQDAGSIQSLKESLMATPNQLSTERVGSLMAALKRWKRFALPRKCPKHAPPRDIVVAGPLQPVVRVYSDASFEQGVLRLGWIIFHPDHSPTGGTCIVPQSTLDSWKTRKQQIFPGEALSALVIPRLHPQLFLAADVLWFIDNEAAVASLIRASSLQPDVHLICLLAHAWIFRQGTRIWYEWIDSASNPSDGLSRDGIHDVWTLQQGWDINEYPFPCDLLPDAFFSSLLASLF